MNRVLTEFLKKIGIEVGLFLLSVGFLIGIAFIMASGVVGFWIGVSLLASIFIFAIIKVLYLTWKDIKEKYGGKK